MTPAARLEAAIALLEVIESAPRKPADAVANDFFRARRYIGGGDRRAVSERAWSVLRAMRRLTWWLERASPGGATPRLLVAGALLLEGSSIEAVDALFAGGQYAPAPLEGAERVAIRALSGQRLNHPDMPQAVRLEVPDWLLPGLAARFGADLEAELGALSRSAPLDLRVNLLKSTREQAIAALAAEAIEASPMRYSPWGLRIAGRKPVTTGAAFRNGLVEIQDEGSQLVALLLGARPGMRVADYCAGAAGKTLAVAMMMQNQGHIVACDVSVPRLEGAVRRLRRADIHNVERHLLVPGDKWTKRRAGGFDRVLVDAPCTGTGTWRRNPDARLRLAPSDLAELRVKQAAILADAARLVRKGGRIVYATCSVLPEENEEQVDLFLSRHPDFAVLPIARAWEAPGTPPESGAYLVLSPRLHGTDGFFAAVLERAA